MTQARTRAEATTGAPAEVLAGAEQITLQFNRRVQANNNHAETTVDFQAGDTPAQQITRLNDEISNQNWDMTAYLDANGHISIRSTEYGDDYFISMQSNLVAAAGTSRIGAALTDGTGTDLEGRIGNIKARVLDGTHLKGRERVRCRRHRGHYPR